MATCKVCTKGGGNHEFKHGLSGYEYHKCRCDTCKKAVKNYAAAYRQKNGSCRKCSEGIPHNYKHGTESGYGIHRCRCNPCREAWNSAAEHRRRARGVKKMEARHGTTYMYVKYGCRCDACIARMRTSWEQRNRRRGVPPRKPKQTAEQRRVVARDYYQRNRERIREWTKEWRSRNAAHVRERSRDYYWRNREQQLEAKKRQYDRNPRREYDRMYRQSSAGKAAAARQAQRKNIPVSRCGRWTREEQAIALRTDLTVVEKAYQLGRSPVAVQGMSDYLRHREARIRAVIRRKKELAAECTPKVTPRANKHWGSAEISIALDDSIDIKTKCHRLGRSYRSVRWKIEQLAHATDTPQ